MRAPYLVLPLLLAVAPAGAGARSDALSPGVKEAADAPANTDAGADDDDADDDDDRSAGDDDGWDDEEPSGPPGPVTVLAYQTFSAGLHWTGGALASISVANIALRDADRKDDRRDLSLGAALAAGPFLAGWGAHLVGDYHDRPGSYWAAVGGAAAGEALGFGAARLLDRPSRLQEFLFPAVLSAVGAAAGSFLTSAPPDAGPSPAGGAAPAVTGGLSLAPDGGGLKLTLAGAY